MCNFKLRFFFHKIYATINWKSGIMWDWKKKHIFQNEVLLAWTLWWGFPYTIAFKFKFYPTGLCFFFLVLWIGNFHGTHHFKTIDVKHSFWWCLPSNVYWKPTSLLVRGKGCICPNPQPATPPSQVTGIKAVLLDSPCQIILGNERDNLSGWFTVCPQVLQVCTAS